MRFLITILLSVAVYSQDENSLINKKNLLLEEIELSKKTLNSAKNQKKNHFNERTTGLKCLHKGQNKFKKHNTTTKR